ncbi:MAG: hypothetical protein M3373_13965 [Gemmatimonadota bacterium]|nr:hypothetical protein [Gemmatimonadota bacterium]
MPVALAVGVGTLAGVAVSLAGLGVGFALGTATGGYLGVRHLISGADDEIIARIPVPGEPPLDVTRADTRLMLLTPDADGAGVFLWCTDPMARRTALLSGADALRACGYVLPSINRNGASLHQVEHAVALLETAGAASVLSHAAHTLRVLPRLSLTLRLALEMAAHENLERIEAHEDLLRLEQAWRSAEEIAAISDSLLSPATVMHQLERLRKDSNESSVSHPFRKTL